MDPLSALAIATAVVQFVDIGGKLLAKGWAKYKQMRQGQPTDEELANQQELKKIFDELSLQVAGFQQIYANMTETSQSTTPAQLELLHLLSECHALATDLDQIKSQIKPPTTRQMNSEIHWNNHIILDSSRRSRRMVSEEDCVECRKRRRDERAEFDRNLQLIKRVTEQFKPLRRKVIESVILCLWDDSKRTQQWELHFNAQMNKAIDLLERAEKQATNARTSAQGQHHQGTNEGYTQASEAADEELSRLTKALQPLFQPEHSPLSLKQLRGDMIDCLRAGVATSSIRKGLVKLLWAKDWRLDISMAGDSSAQIDTAVVSRGISAGIEFNTIYLREDAIPRSFESTYSWIFRDEPPVEHNVPRWYSFPKWLKDDSHKVYWITGKPGSGKSTIMKLIIQHESVRDTLSQSLGSLRPLLVKYYAWHPGHTLQKSLEGLKRTIIFQALNQCPELTPQLTPRRWAFCQVLRRTTGLPAWHTWEIEESFEALLSLCGTAVKLALFIDGLDEFDVAPVEVINCIRHIKANCHGGLKVCAASRPWPEFQDEFNDGPMLQMHLQTQEDMRSFITKSFADNRGFIEQQQMNPQAASQLLADILQRANGVFLWVSIVTHHLLDLLREGQSISQARKALEALPSDISSLYDAIWASIRPKNLADASFMLQILRASTKPPTWFIMWLIEEMRFGSVSIDDLPLKGQRKDAAIKSLRRRIAARTKCILELNGNTRKSCVDFVHRTARDWALKPDKWKKICSSSTGQFDPHLCILQAETFLISDSPDCIDQAGDARRAWQRIECGFDRVEGIRSVLRVWDRVERALWHAGQVRDSPENRRVLLDCLNSFDYRIRRLSTMYHVSGQTKINESGNYYRADVTKGRTELHGIEITFLGLTAQFAVLPYIKAATTTNPGLLSQGFSEHTIGLLESAIFGYSHYWRHSGRSSFDIPPSRRLATVKYLLDKGVHESKVHTERGVRNLRTTMHRTLWSEYPVYCSKVLKYLDQKNYLPSLKQLELRIRLCLGI